MQMLSIISTHSHSDGCIREQLGIFGMRTGVARDQTINLPISRRRALPPELEPAQSDCMLKLIGEDVGMNGTSATSNPTTPITVK